MKTLLRVCVASIIISISSSWWNGLPWCYLMGSTSGFTSFDGKRLMYKGSCPAVAAAPCDKKKFNQRSGLPSDFRIDIGGFTTYTELGIYNSDELVIKELLITIGKRCHSGTYRPRLLKGLRENSCGICGYYDGKAQNDLRLPGGGQADTLNSFFKGWTLKKNSLTRYGVNRCPAADGQKKSNDHCPPGQIRQAKKVCDLMLDRSKVFGKCLAIGDQYSWFKNYWQTHYDSCVQLACRQTVSKLIEAACFKMDEIGHICLNYMRWKYSSPNVQLDWRKDAPAKCTPKCGRTEEFTECARDQCVPSCEFPNGRNPNYWYCRYPKSSFWGCEGKCVCKSGYLRNKRGRCVLAGNC